MNRKNLIHLHERRRKLRQEIDSQRSPAERSMDRKLERLIEVLDDMDARIQDLEQRQLQIVRALNELLTRLEQTEE